MMDNIRKSFFNKKDGIRKVSLKKKNKIENNIILTTRVRTARNLAGYKFGNINTAPEKKEILQIIKSAFFNNNKSEGFDFYNISRLSKIQRQFLVEKYVLSPEMVFKLYSKGLILKFNEENFDESLSILINEEDHLKVQCVIPGLNIQKAYKEVQSIEKILEKRIKFDFDKDFGYLTSSPANLGSGLKISAMVHIPAIIISGKIEEFVKKLNNIGCNIRGFFGENSEVVGNIIQISNQISLGKSEKQILEEMNAIYLNIIDEEKNSLKYLRKDISLIVEDSVMRSYGMLRYAKILSYYEAVELLSMLKMGIGLDLICKIRPFDFFELISNLGDANIILSKNLNLEPESDEVDKIRMQIIREKIL